MVDSDQAIHIEGAPSRRMNPPGLPGDALPEQSGG